MNEPRSEIIPALPASDFPVPAIIAAAGDKASEHFLEFFAATIRNKNTRAAYMQAIAQFYRKDATRSGVAVQVPSSTPEGDMSGPDTQVTVCS